MLENFFNSPILTSLALTLLHFLWQGLLVAAVLKSALLIFNNNKPQLRYALSAFAMLVNLLLPIATFTIIYQTEILSVNTLTSSFVLNELIQELKQPDVLFTYRELSDALPLLLPYLSILWLVTITLLASKLLIEITTVNKLPRQSTMAPNAELQARFSQLAKQINLTIKPRLLISLKVDVPMAIGWLKPVVLLPANMVTGLNSAQLEMLLLHELAHIRRHDYLVNFLQTLVEILLFFHPAVLWVSKQMRNEREYCSDDIAVKHCGSAMAYAHTLADTASLCTKTHNHTIPAIAMAASGGDLKQRVVRLVDHHCAPSNNISKWFASATIIFSILLLSSKQLLTMPLLDIWYNKTPWKQLNQIKGNKVEETQMASSQKPVIIATAPQRQLVNNHSNTNLINKNITNTSIAQQLLTPSKQDNQPNKHNLQTVTSKKTVIKTANKEDTVLASKKRSTQTKTQIKTNGVSEFSAKLTSLAPTHSTKPQKNVEDVITSDSLMVEKAFSRTDSNNSYQAELVNLTTPPEQNVKPLNIKSYQNKTITNNITNLPALEQSKTLLTKNNLPQKAAQEIVAVKTTWQNAEQLESVDPIYPSLAKRKGIEIEVKVDFTIDINGQIKNIQFDTKNNINYFKSSIRSAIRKWRFLPAKIDNQPVESQMSKVFAFSLQS